MQYSTAIPGLLLLESTFIFSVLALLFHQRKNIGDAPFVMSFTALNIFTLLILGADIQATLFDSIHFSVPQVVMFSPLMMIYFLVYIVDGTLAAQRFIYGLLVVSGITLYIAEAVYLQCSWGEFALLSGVSGPALEALLSSSISNFLKYFLELLFCLFWIPIIYSQLIELRFSRSIAVMTALLSSQLALVIPNWLIMLGAGMTPQWFTGEQLASLVIYAWLGALLSFYLKLTASENEAVQPARAMDLFFAFFGSYGRNKQLEKKLTDWENRYKLVLENAAEIIVIFDRRNCVSDANIAARKLFGTAARKGERHLINRFSDFSPDDFDLKSPLKETRNFRCSYDTGSGEPVRLFASISPITMFDQDFRVMIARDITQEVKLTEEKRVLAEQLAHSQRLESMGVLAGGVAHDFNNYIHAILGHVDVAKLRGSQEKVWSEKIEAHMDHIITIAEKAGKLTRQLLGFARRGNYVESDFDPSAIVRETFALVGPKKLENIKVEINAVEGCHCVHGDKVQMQQVLINIVLNAAYAMEKNEDERHLECRLSAAAELPEQFFVPPPEMNGKVKRNDFCCIAISDNGCGMDEDTRKNIFEPFFTTKPVGVGSGMGLSMAYGIVTNCGGWIAVSSVPGKGSCFRIFLPEVKNKEEE